MSIWVNDKDRFGLGKSLVTYYPMIPKNESRFMRYLYFTIPMDCDPLGGRAYLIFDLDSDAQFGHANRGNDVVTQQIFVKKNIVLALDTTTRKKDSVT